MQTLDEVIGIAIGQEQIQIAIVVVVKKFQPPTTQQASGLANSRQAGLVIVGAIVIVLIDRVLLHINVRDKQIHPAVLIEIC